MKKNIILPVITALSGVLIGYFVLGAFSSDEVTGKTSKSEEKAEEIWTCSMHPQIRKPEPGDCPICGMDLIPAKSSTGGDPLVFEMSEDAVRIANIQTTTVVGSSSSNGELTLSGKMKVDETTSSSVVTHVSGRIERLYVSFTGERVYAGQRVARMYSPDLITAQRELLEAKKIEDLNPRLLEAAKNKLRYWKISDKVIDKIIESGKIQEYFDIHSQHSGVISRKMVSVGDYLGQGGALFELQNLNKLWAVFDVYENDLSAVSVGDEISFTTPSLPEKVFKSKVTFIDPIINAGSRTAGVRMEMRNGGKELKPDMFITGTLKTNRVNSSKSSVQVPKSAVLWTGERSVVYVKLENMSIPSFEFREVTIGGSIGDNYEILDGVKAGDKVVTKGAFVIDASAQLNNQASMMNRSLVANNIETKTKESSLDFKSSTPKKFQYQLDKVMELYLSIKDALVGDESHKAMTQAKSLLLALDKVDMMLVKDDAHIYWMKQQVEIKKESESISKKMNIKEQRKSFESLSEAIIKAMQAFGSKSTQLYVQNCPMAADGKGANWLSKSNEVLNPYYGEQMLTCGSVLDSIKSK